MSIPEEPPITRLLERWRRGDPEASHELMPLIYDELRAIADRFMRAERPGHTLQATALVHEAYVRLFGAERVDFVNRAHFFAAAARAVRRVLVDHARARGRDKRGGGLSQADAVEELAAADPDHRVLAVDRALHHLAEQNPTQARLVELRYFGGLSTDEAAAALGLAPRTAARDWTLTKAWLSRALREELGLDE